MAYGQPFYTFPNGTQYNNAYVPPQMPNTYYGQPQIQPNPQNQAFNGFQQQQAQMGQPQQMQGAQQNLNRSDIIPMMYATYAEATAYRVEPMQKIMFSITDKPLFMLKQADINGRTMVEEYPIIPKQTAEHEETPKANDFIKRSELNNYATVEQVKSEIKGITIDLAKQLEEVKKMVNKGANKNG